MSKFEEEPVATVEVIPTFDGNEINFKPSSKLGSYLIAEGEVELYLKPQQQALPVVPDCVAKTLEILKKYPNSTWSKLYESLGEEGVVWLNNYQLKDERFGFGGLNNKLFVLFHLAINGYTVEKEKRYYLKHIDMSKADKELDYYLAKEEDGTLSHDMPNKGQFPWHPESRFTQQEIESMQTGSYEQIEVPVEDGE